MPGIYPYFIGPGECQRFRLDAAGFAEAKRMFKNELPALPVMVREAQLEYALIQFLKSAAKNGAFTLV
jgi:hypothetical protein